MLVKLVKAGQVLQKSVKHFKIFVVCNVKSGTIFVRIVRNNYDLDVSFSDPKIEEKSRAVATAKRMFGRFSFLPTLCYNVFMEKVSSRQWFNRIDDSVILGALPFRRLVPQLVSQENVKAVISMNENFELKFWVPSAEEWKNNGVDFLQLSTADIFHAPNQQKIEKGIAFIKQIEGHGTVYVHCKAGRTRSATLVACYLIQKHGWKPNEAVDFMEAKRPHILLRSKQWEAINLYYKNFLKSKHL